MNDFHQLKVDHVYCGLPSIETANGVSKSVYLLALEEAAQGADVHVHAITHERGPEVPGTRGWFYDPPRIPFRLPTLLLRRIAERRPHVVFLHSVYTPINNSLAMWLRRKGIPYVTRPAGGLAPSVMSKRSWLKYPYKLIFETSLHNGALFVHSYGEAEDIRRYGIVAPIVSTSRGHWLPRSLPTRIEARRQLGLPENAQIAAFVGRFHVQQKGLDTLLDAARQVRTRDFLLIICGVPATIGNAELADMVAAQGLSARVKIMQPLYGPEKYKLLVAADVFVHPSRWEGGVPNAVVEAASVGTPVIVTASADPEGQIGECKAGLVVPGYGARVAEAIDELFQMPASQLETLSENARNMVVQYFDGAKVARLILEQVANRTLGSEVR
jgi:glycosyltransferase involved in cell wall biosynthesis